MHTHTILTPYFLDEPLFELEELLQEEWALNRPPLPRGKQQARLAALHRPLAQLVAGAVDRGWRPVSIAGDCCTAIAVLAGLHTAGMTPSLIWFDAHGDFNTWETTPSGFLGGMPLAMLVGRGEQTLLHGVGLPPLQEDQVLLVGARDLDPGEWDALRNSQVKYLASVDAFLDGPLPTGPLYVHFDTDVIRPEDAPAMNYPAPGGPSVADLASVFHRLAGTGQIVAVSMSTWNPRLPGAARSRATSMAFLNQLLAGD